MKKILLGAMVAATLTSCTGHKTNTVILYYSQTGTTKALAEEIQKQTGADICRFDVVQEYSGTYEQTIDRYILEHEQGFIPDLKPFSCNLSKYDVVFICYPVWFGTYATPVEALIKSVNLEGKIIVPFCTFGSGGLQSSSENLKKALRYSHICNGYGVRSARIERAGEELNRFLIENDWKDGEIEALPRFSQQEPVTDKEAEIFDAACSGYKYPIGTPRTSASRIIPGGTEYAFIADGFTPKGEPSTCTVFVNCIDGCTPEFTQVIR